MKTLIQLSVLVLGAILIATLHPFQLAMPWQSGSPATTETALLRIIGSGDYERTEIDVGRLTPFNYRAAEAVYRTTNNLAETCTDLRLRLDEWGVVADIVRREDGCDIEADGPGPMTATISVIEDPEELRALRIDIRVQHTP